MTQSDEVGRSGPVVPRDPRRKIIIFKGGMAAFKADLGTWSNNYSVTAQTILSGPTVWVKIVANDDGED